MADDRSVADGTRTSGRRFVSQLYATYAAAFAGMALFGALVLGVTAARDGRAWIGAGAASLLAARLAWMAVRGGAWLDSSRQQVTVRGLVRVSRLNRGEISEIEIRSRDGAWPRGRLRGERTVFLRGLSFRHTHRVGRGGGLGCPDCFADRQAMIDLADALGLSVVESD